MKKFLLFFLFSGIFSIGVASAQLPNVTLKTIDGKTVNTIEGNSRDVCKRKSYTRGSGLIYGYGCPNYSGR